MYQDGFVDEELLTTGDGPRTEEGGTQGAPAPAVPSIDPVTASRAELASLGLTVVDGGRI